MVNTALSTTDSPIGYTEAKRKALSLIRAFKLDSNRSVHYPKIKKLDLVDAMTQTVNGVKLTLNQGKASLCGPAAFLFVIVKTRPDLYIQAAIELYLTGKSKLTLESSKKAKSRNPPTLTGLDWMLMTSVKPKYDNTSERFDGITLPGKLKRWFQKSGYSAVETHTSKVFNKSIRFLLSAQTDYIAGCSICLFVDANIFRSIENKRKEAFFPNHWVVLNSDMKIIEYDNATGMHKPPVVINSSIIDRVTAKDKKDREKTRIMLVVFTWGLPHYPASSKISTSQAPNLEYFLGGFHGYIKVKR